MNLIERDSFRIHCTIDLNYSNENKSVNIFIILFTKFTYESLVWAIFMRSILCSTLNISDPCTRSSHLSQTPKKTTKQCLVTQRCYCDDSSTCIASGNEGQFGIRISFRRKCKFHQNHFKITIRISTDWNSMFERISIVVGEWSSAKNVCAIAPDSITFLPFVDVVCFVYARGWIENRNRFKLNNLILSFTFVQRHI